MNPAKEKLAIKYLPLLRKAFRFSLTGILMTLIHASIVILLVSSVSLPPPISNGLAFALATIASYLINTLWSFSAPLHGRTLSRFILVSIFGLCVSIFISWIIQLAGYSYLVGIAGVAVTVPVVTFFLHTTWTYR
ncbi:GtrA family protein [Pseudomonas putida]|uniref:GtrA family protein n=1 Tax=Pseudomonas putida TaxID=303 RepID=UPI0037CB36BF